MSPGVLINILSGLLAVGLTLYLISLIPTKPETAWVSRVTRGIAGGFWFAFAIIWLISLLAGWLDQYPQHR
jgi:hypothetical protein